MPAPSPEEIEATQVRIATALELLTLVVIHYVNKIFGEDHNIGVP